jgi:hypothetical protein
MDIKTIFCDNYFPPTIIEVKKYKDGSYLNFTTYLKPNNGIYDARVVGIWKVKYKKINPKYYCDGQRDVHGCH